MITITLKLTEIEKQRLGKAIQSSKNKSRYPMTETKKNEIKKLINQRLSVEKICKQANVNCHTVKYVRDVL